jgi:MerR family copper efflux transcriptional regulator
MNIAQVAAKLGVSTRTVRRYIKAGKIQAELISGHFGEEYRILDIPPELCPTEHEAEAPGPGRTPSQGSGQSLVQAIDIIRELQEKNLALAAQLGVATERIRNLEGKIKLLTAPKQRWWRRFFERWAKQKG